MTEIAARLVRPIRRLGPFSLVAIGLVVLLVGAGAIVAARAYAYKESVLPGVRVAGVDVGGLSEPSARVRIETVLGQRLQQPLDIAVGDDVFKVTPSNLFTVDAQATEELAYDSARSSVLHRLGALAAPFAVAQDVEPVLRVNQSALAALADELAKRSHRAVSARISMRGQEPVVVTGKAGSVVEEAAVLRLVRDAALTELPSVRVPVRTVAPAITTAAAERAADEARIAVSTPVGLRFRHRDLGALAPATLASLLRFKPQSGSYELALAPAGLRDELAPLMKQFTKNPVDASFRVDGERVHVVKGRNGTQLDLEGANTAVLAAATGAGTREAQIGLSVEKPELTTNEAKTLGIRRQVSTFTTDMGISSANRIWNVHLMADYIDGTIIRPGQMFSFNKTVGQRTEERGFREGQMILGSLLLPAIGGGVCQTATTLFNNALALGLPITERRNHSWYISHYPLGRDATVSWGGPDLKFENDLDHALLIKTSYTDSTLTFTFYGTKQGRRVVTSTGPQTNFTSPQTSYAYDPAAPEGSVRTVAGTHESGFDVAVYRKVYEGGKLIRKDSFASRYVPVGDTIVYGPGTDPPRIDFTIPAV